MEIGNVIASGFKMILMAIVFILSLIWYPFKERGEAICECCGKRLRPHNDPAYGAFE